MENWKKEAEGSNYSLLEDAKTDMFQFFEEEKLEFKNFDYSTATDLQLLLIIFTLSYGDNIKIYNNYIDENESDEFLAFYIEFYNWFIKSEKIRKRFSTLKFFISY